MSDTNTNTTAPAATKPQVPSIPKKIYKLRCVDASNTQTKNGNKNLRIVCEFHPKDGNTPTMVNGVCIDGIKITGNSVVTPKTLYYVNKARSAFGLADIKAEEIESIDAAEFIGNECFAVCIGKTETDNEEDGTPMVDPYTGEPKVINKREILEWIRRPSVGE